jgi:hypothetical protein
MQVNIRSLIDDAQCYDRVRELRCSRRGAAEARRLSILSSAIQAAQRLERAGDRLPDCQSEERAAEVLAVWSTGLLAISFPLVTAARLGCGAAPRLSSDDGHDIPGAAAPTWVEFLAPVASASLR